MVKSTILVENKTRESLKTIGRKEQTYDDIINELLNIRKKKIYSKSTLGDDYSNCKQ